MKYLDGFFMSIGMFSVIPTPYRPWNEEARKHMLIFLPLVGLIIGLIWYALFMGFEYFEIAYPIKAAVLLIFPFFITGFIHLDGYMDTCDALLSRRSYEEKLRILKDPSTGAFAVISVIILFIMGYSAISSVFLSQSHELLKIVIFIPVISRCCSSIAILVFKPLSHSQYSEGKRNNLDGNGKPHDGKRTTYNLEFIVMLLIIIFGAIIISFLTSPDLLLEFLIIDISIIVTYSLALAYAYRQFLGVSGDITGYALTISEVMAMVMLAILI